MSLFFPFRIVLLSSRYLGLVLQNFAIKGLPCVSKETVDFVNNGDITKNFGDTLMISMIFFVLVGL